MTLTAANFRADLKCGRGAISPGEKCSKGPSTKALLTGAAITALGVGLALKGSRKAILTTPSTVKRASQGLTREVLHRIHPVNTKHIKFKGEALDKLRASSKTEIMAYNAREARREAIKNLKKVGRITKGELSSAGQLGRTAGSTVKAGRLTAGSLTRKARLTSEYYRRKLEPGYRKPRFPDSKRDSVDYRGETFAGYNKPKATSGHPKKSHAVLAKEGSTIKLIRFGQQGVSGSPKKEGESESYAKRRKSFKARHARNINKGKMSAAYWADKVKW